MNEKIKERMVARPSNPSDELVQNVSKKKFPLGRIIPRFFFESSESDRFLNYSHDSNSIFRAGRIISEGKHMELLDKQGRRPRSSMELLTNMCWEDVPQMDEALCQWASGASTRSCKSTAMPSRFVEDATWPRTRLSIPTAGLCYPTIRV